jgi:hypothetical protein
MVIGAHSMTSSASICIEFGTARPSVLAALRLTTNSNFVDCASCSVGSEPMRHGGRPAGRHQWADPWEDVGYLTEKPSAPFCIVQTWNRGGRRLGTFAMTSPKEYRENALECGKQALETTDERLRRILLGAARLWMDTAEVENESGRSRAPPRWTRYGKL